MTHGLLDFKAFGGERSNKKIYIGKERSISDSCETSKNIVLRVTSLGLKDEPWLCKCLR